MPILAIKRLIVSASEKLSEGEEILVTPKGDGPEPMVGSPPLFTPIPSTSAMMLAAEAAHLRAVHNPGVVEDIFHDLHTETASAKPFAVHRMNAHISFCAHPLEMHPP